MENTYAFPIRDIAATRIMRKARVSLAAAKLYAEHLRMTGPEQDAWAPIGAVANRVVDRLELALPDEESAR